MTEQLVLEGFAEPKGAEFSGHPVANLLPLGPEHPVKLRELVQATGMDERQVRLALRLAVINGGVPIVCDYVRGFWIATTVDDRDRCVRSLRSRAKEILRRADALEKAEVEDG